MVSAEMIISVCSYYQFCLISNLLEPLKHMYPSLTVHNCEGRNQRGRGIVCFRGVSLVVGS